MQLRGLSALPAAQRAADIESRIAAVGANHSISSTALHLVNAADRTNIMAGNERLLSVFDEDAAAEGVADRQLLAQVYRDRVARAIDQYREERSSGFIIREIEMTLVTLAIVIILVLALRWGSTRLVAVMRRKFTQPPEAVEARSFNLLTAMQLGRALEGLIGALYWLIAFVVVFVGAEYALSRFPWTRLFSIRASSVLVDPLRAMWSGLVAALPGMVFVAIVAITTQYVLRLLQVFFVGIGSERIQLKGFAHEWAWPTYRLVRIAIVAFAIVIAYPYIPGSGSDAFKGISIFFGLLMSLGAASAVTNSLAGYTLIYRRTFKVGDRIRVGDVVGDVVEMRQQVTHLKSTKNEIVTIPSSTMLTSQVTNYSALAGVSGLILHTTVGIGYETPWRQVEAMLLLAASRTEGLERDPAAFVLLKELGDFAVVYEINAYCKNPQTTERVYAALHRSILDAFNEFDVAIMTPAYVADPAVAKMVPRDKWYLAPATPRADSTRPF